MSYKDEKDFKDFKDNFHTLIEIFNHNVTDLKEDMREIKNDVKGLQSNLETTKIDVAEIKGTTKFQKSLILWVLGIVASITVAAIISTIK